MAKGWRGYLEEESEFQWIAMAGFLAFILLGALAIQGTSNLPGVEVGSSDSSHYGKRILDIDYTGDESFTAKILNDGGIDLFQQNDRTTVTQIMTAEDGLPADDINFITSLENGNTAISPSTNTIQVIHSPQNEAASATTITTFELDRSHGNFTVMDLAESSDDQSTQWMMVTMEGSKTSLRGFGTIGSGSESSSTIVASMSSSILSTPMVNTADAVWQKVIALGNEKWVASGYLSYTSNEAGASPAAPKIIPVLAVIDWEGGLTAPTVSTMHSGEGGLYHSLMMLDDGDVFAAGDQGSTLVSTSGSMTHLNVPSVAAVVDCRDRVWLFGDVGSKTIVRYSGENAEKLSLSQALTFQIESKGHGKELIYLHGTDERGEAQTLLIDTSAPGSIESGRGFLNFLFLTVFSITMGVMAWTAGLRLLAARRP
ncbi:MAG TPA: hypothetical protein D7H89_01405 [Candidatus Poseidoniales archaeon]|nr:MAG TPA: hypothetical protein D7H89_01405 [Candidatus Poseidoniales archaeon]HII86591.1 hypothetical protein [Candidatus Poseidoniaceae archaeon]